MTRFSSSTNYHGILAVKVFCRYIYKIGIGAETEKRIRILSKATAIHLQSIAKLMAVAFSVFSLFTSLFSTIV